MGENDNKNDLFNSTMSLGDHLEELRMRLILALAGVVVCSIFCLFFGSKIITFIEKPYINVMGPEARLQTLAPADGFVSYMKISLISGLILSCPWVFYQLWMFISAGLYPNEKRYVHLATPFSAALFVAGALFFIFVVAPITLGFLVKFNEKILGVSSSFTFRNYISFVTTLMLVFGIAFQTPVAILFLNRTGLVSLQVLRRSRKFVLLGVFVVAAVATPPDVISQITLALPLYLLFELGILLSYFANRKKRINE
ncbi:MAG: twin-arginine translocase subunit TatC [Planctomycetota bacterium]|nr:MAG: twin-arginine translocase subunit TatC [Planctomycetota bacterium]